MIDNHAVTLLCSGTGKNGAEGAFLFVIHFLVTNEHGCDSLLHKGETIGIGLALLHLSVLNFFLVLSCNLFYVTAASKALGGP